MRQPDQLLATMRLEEKVGQLFLVAIRGTRVSLETRRIVRDLMVGGVYTTNSNFVSPCQAAEFTSQLQKEATGTRCGIPLLVAADHEGHWAVLTPCACPGPGNMGLGANRSPQATRRMYAIFAAELLSVGINTNLAPVADVNSNPANPIIGLRSFGENPKRVALCVKQAVKALGAGGIISTVKHFPGHGNTSSDSHSGLPRVDRSREDIERVDLLPFRIGIEAGAEMVMTSHIVFSALDPNVPATFSERILKDLLRKSMGFEGVVLTDSLNMGAITKHREPADACVESLRAGADVILLAQEQYDAPMEDFLASYDRLVEAVTKAVDSGLISEVRLNESVGRILDLKARYKLSGLTPAPTKALRIVGCSSHREVELDVCRGAITIARNNGILPLGLQDRQALAIVNPIEPENYGLVGRTRGIGPNLGHVFPYRLLVEEVRRRHANVLEFWVNCNTPRLQDHLNKIKELSDVVIVVTEKLNLPGFAFPDEGQVRIVKRTKELGKPVIVAALRDPYDLGGLGEVDAYVCAFSCRQPSVIALTEVLFGERKARGRLPVSVPSPPTS